MIGRALEACTSATMSCELAIAVIIQAAPTAWIRPPKFDAMLANQIIRKVGTLKGAKVEIRSGTAHPRLLYSFQMFIGEQRSISSSFGAITQVKPA
jgi:hypothetical protein